MPDPFTKIAAHQAGRVTLESRLKQLENRVEEALAGGKAASTEIDKRLRDLEEFCTEASIQLDTITKKRPAMHRGDRFTTVVGTQFCTYCGGDWNKGPYCA